MIRAVVIFAEGLFDGESHVVHPPNGKLKSIVKIPLLPDKDIAVDLSIQAFVGHSTSTQFHVFEATRHLPRFSLYIPCPLATEPHPQGKVTFNVPERLERITTWLNDSFMYGAGEDAILTPFLHVAYLSLRTSFPVILKFEPALNGTVSQCSVHGYTHVHVFLANVHV
jgi:Bardet-Biedl syndrome 2 protein